MIHLRERYGDTYRVVYEESYYAQHGPNAHRVDPAYQIIRCRGGHHIFPWGGDTLAVSLDKAPRLSKRLQAIGCRVQQSGDDGDTLVFDVGLFDQVAAIVKPYRRPRLTPERRAAMADRMRKVRAQETARW